MKSGKIIGFVLMFIGIGLVAGGLLMNFNMESTTSNNSSDNTENKTSEDDNTGHNQSDNTSDVVNPTDSTTESFTICEARYVGETENTTNNYIDNKTIYNLYLFSDNSFYTYVDYGAISGGRYTISNNKLTLMYTEDNEKKGVTIDAYVADNCEYVEVELYGRKIKLENKPM